MSEGANAPSFLKGGARTIEEILTELCQELRNWFEREKYIGIFDILDGVIYSGSDTIPLLTGQYYRIIGSVFNDGIHQYGDEDLQAETFDGAVWALAIPKPVIKLAAEIEAWRNKYESADSPAMSPFTGESFGGYSYQKAWSANSGGNEGASWKSVFASQMSAWRKL